MIEVNSLSVINALSNCNKPIASFVSSSIKHYRYLLQLLGNPIVRHVYREANIVAKNVVYSSNDLAILDGPINGLYT